MKRFCPKCGKEVEEDNMIHNFCVDCYLSDHDIIKAHEFKITYCPKCGNFRYAKKTYKNVEDLEKELAKHVKVKDIKQSNAKVKLNLDFEKKVYYADIIIKALISNKITNIEKKQPISFRIEPCKVCSRLAGHYYTTILQIRFDTKKLKEKIQDQKINIINKKIKEINSNKKNITNPINIVKVKEKKKGLDLYINDLKHTNNILSELSKDSKSYGIQHTKTLVGMEKNGQRRYRYTLCIHFGK
jgi:NMD protein affecting ribosome stability and mRNA decay